MRAGVLEEVGEVGLLNMARQIAFIFKYFIAVDALPAYPPIPHPPHYRLLQDTLVPTSLLHAWL